MTIAKARKGAAMPVVHHANPRIAEYLPITRAQISADRQFVLPDWRLRRKSCVFERDVIGRIVRQNTVLRGLARLRYGYWRRRDISCACRRGEVRHLDRRSHPNWIPEVRIALSLAVEAIDKERSFGVNGKRLLDGGRGVAGRRSQLPVQSQLHPALG